MAALRTGRGCKVTHPVLPLSRHAVQGFAYVAREVKLELGTLTAQQPTGRYPVRPLLADAFPTLFGDWVCTVTALELQRTFWEKATIRHAEFHRPPDSRTPDRYARHYFDMVKLLGLPAALGFLADKAQCARVVDWKSRVFARPWARYDLAVRGSFRPVPPPQRQSALAQDYATMRPMFMSEPPAFAELMRQLADAEQVINPLLHHDPKAIQLQLSASRVACALRRAGASEFGTSPQTPPPSTNANCWPVMRLGRNCRPRRCDLKREYMCRRQGYGHPRAAARAY